MLVTLMVCLAALLAGQSKPAGESGPLPDDWPPLPDFKRTIDYVQWYEEHTKVPEADDAAPLWAEITEHADDPEPVKLAKAEMWGQDTEGGIPGLLTDPWVDEPLQAWDPRDHLDWEQAYQIQKVYGLHEKLDRISRLPAMSTRMSWGDRRDFGPPTARGTETLDFGLTKDDQLLGLALLPSLAIHRYAVKVVLQNAWRAPEDEADASALIDATKVGLGLANQVQDAANTMINLMVGLAMRSMIYQTIRQAMDDGVFKGKDLARLQRVLARHDNNRIRWEQIQAYEIAYFADFLQFVYLPEGQDWPVPPHVNKKNLEKLSKYVHADREQFPTLSPEPLDLHGEINRCDPRTAVRQLREFHLGIREVGTRQLPQSAYPEIERRYAEFKNDPATHVIVRQFLYCCIGRELSLAAEAEAERRGMQLLCALLRVHVSSGRWPENLDRLGPLVSRELTIDPFSGKEFVYRVEDGHAQLYSVGYNSRDDGGRHLGWRYQLPHQDGVYSVHADYVFWPVPTNDGPPPGASE